jgi:hypothetical protein
MALERVGDITHRREYFVFESGFGTYVRCTRHFHIQQNWRQRYVADKWKD